MWMIEWLTVCQVKSLGPLWYFVYVWRYIYIYVCVCVNLENSSSVCVWESGSVSCSVVSDSFATPMDSSLPGFSVHGISQARVLEWVAILFSRGSSQAREQTHVSCIGRWILLPLSHQGRSCVCLCIQSIGSRRVGHDWATEYTCTQIWHRGSMPLVKMILHRPFLDNLIFISGFCCESWMDPWTTHLIS